MPTELCWSFLELHFETWGKKALSWVNVNNILLGGEEECSEVITQQTCNPVLLILLLLLLSSFGRGQLCEAP